MNITRIKKEDGSIYYTFELSNDSGTLSEDDGIWGCMAIYKSGAYKEYYSLIHFIDDNIETISENTSIDI